MLERETELIKQIIVESTINGRTAIKMNVIVAADLPRGVKAYMVAETMKLLATDFKKSANLSKITDSIAHTVTNERTLLRSLAMEYVFQRDEFLKLVEDTVHFLENYLCRPQWTLHQLVFDREQKVSFERMVSQFEYVVDYSYFGELVERYARRSGWTEIDAGAFKNLVGRIDQEVTRHHSPRELALLTKPIFDFLLFGDPSLNRPIPLGAVLLFFEDKKLNSVKEYIDRICQIRTRTQISMNELLSIIEDLYQVESKVKEEVEQSEQAIFSPQQNIEERPAEVPPEQVAPIEELPLEQAVVPTTENIEQQTTILQETFEASEDPATQPAHEINETDVSEQQIAETTAEPTVETVEFSSSTESREAIKNVNLLLAYASERNALRHTPMMTFPERRIANAGDFALADIDAIITDEQRSTFVRKIFKGDETNYRIFVSSLNKAPTWRDAQVHLRDLFQLNKLDIVSTDVVEFTDAMHSRYEPDLKKQNEVH